LLLKVLQPVLSLASSSFCQQKSLYPVLSLLHDSVIPKAQFYHVFLFLFAGEDKQGRPFVIKD
jgi:hypothetical protein